MWEKITSKVTHGEMYLININMFNLIGEIKLIINYID